MELFSISAIAIICLILTQFVKNLMSPYMATKWTPVVSGLIGGILGGVGFFIGIPALFGLDIYNAIGVGIFSGITSTGLFSGFKNVTGQYEENN